MITRIEIDGFKTFEDFSLSFSPFVTIAGANGSGKSNLFDAIKLLSAMARGDLRSAFAKQRGAFNELFTQYAQESRSTKIRLCVEMFLDQHVQDDFNKEAQLGHQRLRYEIEVERTKDEVLGLERLVVNHEILRPIKKGQDKWYRSQIQGKPWDDSSTKKSLNYKPYINTEEKDGIKVISLRQDGIRGGKPTPVKDLERSVLSGVNDVSFPHVFAVRQEMLSWNFYQLSPIELAKPSPMLGENILDLEGGNLAGLVNYIRVTEPLALKAISRQTSEILPEIKEVFIDEDKARQQYVLMVRGVDGRVFSSHVLSEGTLRIIALIALSHDERHRGLICLEEPENGVHPYRLQKIVKVLQGLTTNFEGEEDAELPLRQVFINTHSPLLIKALQKESTFDGQLIYFSRLTQKIDHEKNLTYQLTRLSPVDAESSGRTNQLFLETLPAERAITHHEVTDYLNSYDTPEI